MSVPKATVPKATVSKATVLKTRAALVLAAASLGLVLAAPAARAQSKNDTRPTDTPAPPEAGRFQTVTVAGQPTPPVELHASLKDGRTVCSPETLRIPAEGAIDLRIRNDADQQLTLASSELFAHGRQVRFDGQIAHAMSEIAYTIQPRADARVVVHTPKAGEYEYSCMTTGTEGSPFKGKVEAVAGQ